MDQLIPIINKLQDVFSSIGQCPVDLPQIVVVGSQSSGKSSVLEAIVGIESFLPRGAGICTRRPLVLQLSNNNAAPVGSRADGDETPSPGEEYGTFLHRGEQRFGSFRDIRSEIEVETRRTVGNGKGVSPDPIVLKIYSPRVLDLTLVDLPGMTRVASGDQPEDIEDILRNMCLSYISNPNVIILAVSAANTDLANSDAVKLARAVDPDGERTIGVLTKLDLMDPGTDASDILNNRSVPLAMGYVGVVNRGQRDVDGDVSIRDGLRKEAAFLSGHSVYRNLQHRCGTGTLGRMLNLSLMHNIRDCLPDIKIRISGLMVDVQHELDALGSPAELSGASLGGALLGLISKFVANFSNSVEGKGSTADGIEMDELYGGARISYIFNDIFVRCLMDVNPFDGLSDEDIRTTICNANGPRPSLFVPEVSFDLLIRRQISRLEQPGLQCADLVYDELSRMASQGEPGELTRYPHLRERMTEAVSGLLRRCVSPTQMMISNLVKIELSYINTSHPDFIGGSKAVAQLMERMSVDQDEKRKVMEKVDRKSNGSDHTGEMEDDIDGGEPEAEEQEQGGLMNFIFGGGKRGKNSVSNNSRLKAGVVKLPQMPERMRPSDIPTDRERIETEIIKSLIESYFNVVRKNFLDLVPKTIMYFLVNHARDSMQNELVSELYIDNQIPALMKEADDIAERRRTCEEMKQLLGRALEIVNEVRDFNTFK